MPTVNLGRVQPIYRGYYNAATAYEPLDFVTYDGNTYFCILNSTGNTPVSGTYWQAMLSGGLAGFGVTATPAELNILDGATVTTGELNVLDGLVATTANLNSTAQLSGRNLIINGSGRVNQRGYVSGTATTIANQYTLDRWRVVTLGKNLALSGTAAGYTMTAPAGGVEQVIEGVNVVGGTYVVNWTGTATCTVGGTARTKGVAFTLTANTDYTLRMTGGTFTNLQLELGSIATPFEHRAISQELSLCQRYAWVPVRQTVSMWATVDSGSSLVRAASRDYPVQMRATPTVSYTISYGTATSFTNSADGCEVTANAFNSASGNNFTITLVSAEL